MINLDRGFRRLFLVLSLVWAAGSGFYLWRFPPPPPAPVDYVALAAEFGGVPAAAAPGPESLSVDEWERRYQIPLRELDEVLRPLTPDQRATARDAFTRSSNEDDLAQRLNGMTLPKEVKARLWDLKAGRLARSSSWRDDPVILPTASPGPSPRVYLDENGNPLPATTEYRSTDPNTGVPVKANATPTPRRLRAWFEIGLIPPLVVFALLEGLLWAARGFSENKQAAGHSE